MPSIFDYLPGIPTAYWENFEKIIEPPKVVILNPNSKNYSLFSGIVDKKGIVRQFSIATNSANLQFTIIIDDRKISATLQDIIDAGYIGYYVPVFPWMSVADTTTNTYVANLLMDFAFRKNVYLYVENPTSTPISIMAMGFHAVLFRTGFYKALADLKAGKEIT